MTNRRIVEKAADLFNRKGYAGTSISDLMKATGMEKGGLYGHFKSKKEIALAALEYNVTRIFSSFDAVSLENKSSIEKLHVLFQYLKRVYEEPYLSAGCPLLNTAIEADDTDSDLLHKVRKYLDRFRRIISEIIRQGIEAKEIRAGIDPEEFAIACLVMLEGGNFVTKVYNQKALRGMAIGRIEAMIDAELAL